MIHRVIDGTSFVVGKVSIPGQPDVLVQRYLKPDERYLAVHSGGEGKRPELVAYTGLEMG